MATAAELMARVAALADPKQAEIKARFFKTGPGEYGAGDRFVGVRVPQLRKIIKATGAVAARDVLTLLRSPIHEYRLLALLLWVRDYARGDEAVRAQIFTAYLANTRHINNWDLVDVAARDIVGEHLLVRSTGRLTTLARSASLWERRIAMIATHAFLRARRTQPTIDIAVALIGDSHDLIHKAVGWMLRELGVHCGRAALESFLSKHARILPRTALRYAIEHMPPARRRYWMRYGMRR